MGATMTTVNTITKDVYGPRIVNQMENEITLLKRIEKTSKGTSSEVGGKWTTFPLKVRRNHGIGYRNELEALQAAGQQGWQTVRVPLKYGYGRVNMSGQTMKLAEQNYQAFASAMTEEMEGLKTDLAKDVNRVLWGDGTGKIAVLTAAGPTNTFTVASGFQYIEVGMLIDVVASGGASNVATNVQITAIDPINKTITVSGSAITVAAGGYVTRTGNGIIGGANREPNGLQNLVTNTTAAVHGLTSTTEPLWQSEVDSTGGALSESKMIAMCDRLRLNGGRPTAIFTDLGTRRAYFNLLTTQRRFTDTKTFEGGITGLAFAYDTDIPVVTDVDAVAQNMYFLREDDFKVYQEADWNWEDTDGNIWKWVVGFDQFEALIKKYWEFAIERRNTQGVMTGITAG